MNRSRERRVATAATVALILAAGAGVVATSAQSAEATPELVIGVLDVVPATGNLDTTATFVTHGTCGPEDTVADLAAVGTGISDDPEAGLVLVRDPVPVGELAPAPGGGGYSVPMYGSWRAVSEDQEFGLPLDGPVTVALSCLSPGQVEAAGADRAAAVGAAAAGDDNVVQVFLAELKFTVTATAEPTQATYGPAPAASPSPSPSPSASPSPSPTSSPSPSPSAAPTPSPSPSPTPSPSPSPSPEILASATESPSPSPTPDASIVTTAEASPTPTPTPTPTPLADEESQVGVTVTADDTTLPKSGRDGPTLPLVVLGLTLVAGGALTVIAFRREDEDETPGA